MPSFRGALICLAPLLLAACAGVGGAPQATVQEDDSGPGSAYGLFLAGEAAADKGESAVAEGMFARAADARDATDDTFLKGQAFTFALLAGDVQRAAQMAPQGPDDAHQLVELGDLVRGVEDMAEGRGKPAEAELKAAEAGQATAIAGALLRPYAAAQAGDVELSIAQPVISNQPIAEFFGSLDQGEMFERAHRYDEAETAYRALIGKGDPGGLASLRLGEMLERRGNTRQAAAIYDDALARIKDDSALTEARARLAAGKPAPPLPPLKRSAAEALMAPASVFLMHKDEEASLAYLRLALRLDPTRDEAWLMVGDALAATGDIAGARAAYEAPKPSSSQYVVARMKLAWSYQNGGDKDQALAVARATVTADPKDNDAAINLADLLRADEKYDESAAILDPLIAAQGAQPDWKLLYMRAVDYQESGRWSDAERDLQRALLIRPDDPELLNFLGYSWIDRGERLNQALAMVQKAVDLNPQSGAMIDSLGWGYYRLGNYQKAVEKLEAAVALEPGDPDVNNHLGDAYWRVGRKLEARFQWARVLTLDPTAKLKTEVETKLKSGLDHSVGPAQVADESHKP
ncbi:MAG TPA: tetratricopeptide repeat protein [Caulobacteraceae bacterium]|jgi:tetratricopeptide (TPR) repeat protein